MDVNERIETKRTALLRAESNDLDVAAVAISTVSMIFAEVFPSMKPNSASSRTPLTELSTSITFLEERLIRAIDWLCIHESTLGEAIVHVNMLMRLFLNNGRLNAARVLLFDLPNDVIQKVLSIEVQGEDVEAQAMEFVHFRTFFDILGNHLRFVELWSKRPSDGSSKIERHNWIKGLDGVVDLTETSMIELLKMDWLKLEFRIDDIHSERRREELARIRQLYIPELVFRLHFMLFEVRDVLPQ
jgi:nuclear pore complex protein Nup107